MYSRTPPILIAEDNADDAFLLKRTIEKFCNKAPIQIVGDGEEALRYLAAEGEYADRDRYPFPSVVITDIKMPKKDGFEVLAWLKHHPECNVIPIIIWSSSALDSDVLRAYKMGANCYFQKPRALNDWDKTVELIVNFWETAKKPPIQLARCAESV
jgi:CheY-like chemotaxis protein